MFIQLVTLFSAYTTYFIDQGIPQNSDGWGHFTKITYQNGGISEVYKYKDLAAKETGFGFGSKDASKRDEFSNAMRTEQYRDTLRREQRITTKQTERDLQKLEELKKRMDETMPRVEPGRRQLQYDIGRTVTTDFDPKKRSDSYYKFNADTGKRMGNSRPVSADYGDGAWNVRAKNPQFGGVSATRTFYDKSHLTVGPEL